MSCVTSASASVLVNGVQGEYFYLAHGLRQGDPISPYLFIVIMEIFNRAIFERVTDRLFRPPLIPRMGRAPPFLAVVDDVLLFSNISHASIASLRNIAAPRDKCKSKVSAEAKDMICATLGWPCEPSLRLSMDCLCSLSAIFSYAGRLGLLKHVLSRVIGI
ncbi:hypothetical protein EJ110_NYTH37830 [Nymphaea thermarum]|nr:hypothetical protein EJ110_NYTH37830 [Nymphaea thermarum]